MSPCQPTPGHVAKQNPRHAAPTRTWRRPEWLLAGLLAGATLLTFSPVLRCGLVNYDDELHVARNAHVQAGLTAEGFSWAWTATPTSNWHPLTWLSLMLDAQVWGHHPWGYHLTNLLLHLANTLLLFGLLCRLTRAVGRSALVALLFAIHPLHVESVAWVSERKDVLSTLFGLLALWAYARYAEAPSWARYLAVFLGLALSLLAKPMLVTLPLLLLLLDYWPLQRWQPGRHSSAGPAGRRPVSFRWLLLEKAPLVGLSLAASAVTVWAQHQGRAIASLVEVSLPDRLANALVSYIHYLVQMVVPLNLVPFYVHPNEGLVLAGGAGLLLAAGTALVLRQGKRWPYLPVGWFWYLGTLVPVIGLVQVGSQAWADRYTYFPLVGIFVLLVWGLADLARYWRCERPAAGLAVAGTMLLMLGSWTQAHYWQNSVVLWEHAIQAQGGNTLAYNNLGMALLEKGQATEAVRCFEDALRLDPDFWPAHASLGRALMSQGHAAEALVHFRKALETAPEAGDLHHDLGFTLMNQGKVDEAIEHFRKALRINPADARTHNHLGLALMDQGQPAEAFRHFQDAVRLDAANAPAHYSLGLICQEQGNWEGACASFGRSVSLQPRNARYRRTLAFALSNLGRTEEARAEYTASLQLDPRWPQAAIRQSWTMATHPNPHLRNGHWAVQSAEQVVQATGDQNARALDALAASYAEVGRFADATAAARLALARASATGQADLARQIEARRRLYEQGQPFHESASGTRP